MWFVVTSSERFLTACGARLPLWRGPLRDEQSESM